MIALKFYIVMFLILGVLLFFIPMANLEQKDTLTNIPQAPAVGTSPWQEQPQPSDDQEDAVEFDVPTILVPAPGSTGNTGNSEKSKSTEDAGDKGIEAISRSRTDAAEKMNESSFRVLDQTTGEIITVSHRDYIRGAVCSEMPATFHIEALKAQAVSAHTYALNLQKAHQQAPDPALKGADFAADPSNWKVFVTEELARERFGDNFLAYWDKICKAADSVADQIMVYDQEPIAAAYHAISTGTTEAAENVWGNPVPYLVPVDSPGDIIAPKFEETETFTSEEMRKALETAFPEIRLGEEPSAWLEIKDRSDSGYVTKIQAGDLEITGLEFREVLGLRSSDIKMEYQNGAFTILTSGYGHGVGLSQYGADYMARQGADWEEILKHYYQGIAIKGWSE